MNLSNYINKIRSEFFSPWMRKDEDQRAYIILAVEDHGERGDDVPGSACVLFQGNEEVLVGLLDEAMKKNREVRDVICKAVELGKYNVNRKTENL